jgi:hypothetical protein
MDTVDGEPYPMPENDSTRPETPTPFSKDPLYNKSRIPSTEVILLTCRRPRRFFLQPTRRAIHSRGVLLDGHAR